MAVIENYVFAASERRNLSDAIALALAVYLEDGLSDEPLFVVRAGTGVPGDETQSEPATVIFSEDADPGHPHVKIVSVVAESPLEEYGDDQEVSQWRIVVDCKASESQGVITLGDDDPRGTDSILSDAVYFLLSQFDQMTEAGFVNPIAMPGTPETSGIDVTNPINLTCEVYNFKQ